MIPRESNVTLRWDGSPERIRSGDCQAHQSAPLRVLVVDDEPLICWSVAETLVSHGDLVAEAENGQEAVRALARAPEPDVVLLDYCLPDSNDLGLLSKIRRLAPHTPV
jgi:CheY-like chemotaxis protein